MAAITAIQKKDLIRIPKTDIVLEEDDLSLQKKSVNAGLDVLKLLNLLIV
jgi:hypothetical protein